MTLVQIQLLNYLLSSGDSSLLTVKGLTYEYFPQFRNEFNFIVNHFKQYNKIPDLATFLNTFPDFEVIEVNESVDYLLKEIIDVKNTNYLTTSFNKISDLLSKGMVDEAKDVVMKASDKLSGESTLQAVDILSDISRYDAYVDKCNDYEKYYLSTGFPDLDNALNGGIDRLNAYFVISARPGIGKTLVMIKMASESVRKGLKVGFYEGEMTVEKIAGRYDTLVSHISNSSINHGKVEVSSAYKRYLDNLKDNHKGSLYILTKDMTPDGRVTVDTLRGFVEKYNLDILFVDQITLLDDVSRGKQFFEQASNISKALKNLQVSKHIPIVVASQQNRSTVEEGKYAETQNLGLSDRIGQDATEVVFLTKKDNNLMQFNIAKARDGYVKNVLNYTIDFDKGEFTYVPDEVTNEEESKKLEDRYSESYEEVNGLEVF